MVSQHYEETENGKSENGIPEDLNVLGCKAGGTAIWTVSIKDREDAEMDIWTASFSTEVKADAFKAAVEEKLKGYSVLETVDVTKDCSELDDDMYLSWIDDRYGEG